MLCGVCDCSSCPEQSWILSGSGLGERLLLVAAREPWDSPGAAWLAQSWGTCGVFQALCVSFVHTAAYVHPVQGDWKGWAPAQPGCH